MPYPYTNPLAGSTAPSSISRPQLSYSDFKGHSKDYFIGIHCGYVAGGYSYPSAITSGVDRYNFSNYSSVAVSVATLTRTVKNLAGASAFRYIGFNNYGLSAGGTTPPISLSQYQYSNIIDRFSFKSEGSASDVGDLTLGRKWLAGHSSTFRGYFSGGSAAPTSYNTTIDRVPFNSVENAVTVGNLTVARFIVAGCSSESRGYTIGGITPPASPGYTVIDSFPFSSDANATDTGDLYVYEYNATGVSSYERGYSVGSWLSPTYGPSHPALAKIQSFPFAQNSTVTSYRNGDLSFYRSDGAGFGSITHGYLAGGANGPESGSPPQLSYNVIDRWPFAVDNVTAADIGDLSSPRAGSAGLQN